MGILPVQAVDLCGLLPYDKETALPSVCRRASGLKSKSPVARTQRTTDDGPRTDFE